jgi:hypothetical protein
MLIIPVSSEHIEDKILWATNYFQQIREKLLKDQKAVVLTAKLKRLIAASQAEMSASGIVAICAKCEDEEGGSCCGKGLENKYDVWLLLINLLLGVSLPKERADPGSCFFLGNHGCLLVARHVICINYICKKIQEQIPSHVINPLRKTEGAEIETLFILHEYLNQYGWNQ